MQVFFTPETRMPSFTETLYVRAGSTSELGALLTISGQSTGMEISLGVDTLPFGTVCTGSQRTQRLGLENRGDLPARFRWEYIPSTLSYEERRACVCVYACLYKLHLTAKPSPDKKYPFNATI